MNQDLCGCDAEVRERDDDLLPPHVFIHECKQCGFWAEYDSDADEYRPTA